MLGIDGSFVASGNARCFSASFFGDDSDSLLSAFDAEGSDSLILLTVSEVRGIVVELVTLLDDDAFLEVQVMPEIVVKKMGR